MCGHATRIAIIGLNFRESSMASRSLETNKLNMLRDYETVDAMMPIEPDALMMVIFDHDPWPDPNSDERFEQLRRKLDAYCRYAASDRLPMDHPAVDRTKLVISVIAHEPTTARMREITQVYTPGSPSYEILVTFADRDAKAASPEKNIVGKPWWKFW